MYDKIHYKLKKKKLCKFKVYKVLIWCTDYTAKQLPLEY